MRTTAPLWDEGAVDIPTDAFLPGAHYDDVIVGAGLTGMVTAVLLARRGRSVAVLEARRVGAAASGHTTAKLTRLQGTRLTKIRSVATRSVTQAYADAQTAGFLWLGEHLDERGVPFERRDAITFAETPEGERKVEREYRLARDAGIPVEHEMRTDLPFETYGAIVLRDQVQFDPRAVLASLVSELRQLGGRVITGARVQRVRASSPVVVGSTLGEVTADDVVVATGIPMLDRGLYFAKVEPYRSYALAYQLADQAGGAMYLNVEQPTRSIRWHGGHLLVGGNGHAVGRADSPAAQLDDLDEWTLQRWPGARRTHAWAAQDYAAGMHVPFVGRLPRGRGRVYLATGYEKWGMTNAVAAALTLESDILGDPKESWMRTLRRRPTLPQALARSIGANAAVGWWYLRSYAETLSHPLPEAAPAEGEAVSGRRGIEPVGVATVDAQQHAVSLVCPHLGACLRWNDAEVSWDCPAHGSRFDATGALLEGPAKRPLAAR